MKGDFKAAMSISSPSPSSTHQPTWSNAIAEAIEEFPLTPLTVLSGAVPEGLRGTLYRNGPGRLKRGGEKAGHWFDGDGAVLAVHLNDSTPQATYRYVKTEAFLKEEAANEYLYTNYGIRKPDPIWKYWIKAFTNDVPLKNAANTSVLGLSDRLLALCEAGKPYALDWHQLETYGPDDLGSLQDGEAYIAHPKVDPQTKHIYSIGVTQDIPHNWLNFYHSDPSGKILKRNAIEFGTVPFLHSFAMAGRYLVCLVPPIETDLLAIVLGLKTYGSAIKWKPEQGTQVIVVDRDSLEVVSRGEAAPWFQWHFGNGYVDADGDVHLDFVHFSDFDQTNEYLRELPTGDIQTSPQGQLHRLRLDPRTGQVKTLEKMHDRTCEFPVVPPQQMGQPWQHTYLAVHPPGTDVTEEWFRSIARFDYGSGELIEADLGENRYVMEPIYAHDRHNSEQGWVLTVVYDGDTDTSEVWIYDSDRLHQEPVCRLGLPQVIPIGFHGTWRPA